MRAHHVLELLHIMSCTILEYANYSNVFELIAEEDMLIWNIISDTYTLPSGVSKKQIGSNDAFAHAIHWLRLITLAYIMCVGWDVRDTLHTYQLQLQMQMQMQMQI